MTDDQIIALLLAARLFVVTVPHGWVAAHQRFAAALNAIQTMRRLGMGEHVDPVTPRLEQARELLQALRGFSLVMDTGDQDAAVAGLSASLDYIEGMRYPSMETAT